MFFFLLNKNCKECFGWFYFHSTFVYLWTLLLIDKAEEENDDGDESEEEGDGEGAEEDEEVEDDQDAPNEDEAEYLLKLAAREKGGEC